MDSELFQSLPAMQYSGVSDAGGSRAFKSECNAHTAPC